MAAMALAVARRLAQRVKASEHHIGLYSSSSSPAAPAVAYNTDLLPCGRGDKKTKRGKRFKGSFGNARPKLEKKIERIKDRVEVPSQL